MPSSKPSPAQWASRHVRRPYPLSRSSSSSASSSARIPLRRGAVDVLDDSIEVRLRFPPWGDSERDVSTTLARRSRLTPPRRRANPAVTPSPRRGHRRRSYSNSQMYQSLKQELAEAEYYDVLDETKWKQEPEELQETLDEPKTQESQETQVTQSDVEEGKIPMASVLDSHQPPPLKQFQAIGKRVALATRLGKQCFQKEIRTDDNFQSVPTPSPPEKKTSEAPDLGFHHACKSASTLRVLRAALNLTAASGPKITLATCSSAAIPNPHDPRRYDPDPPRGSLPLALLAANENLRRREGQRRDLLDFVADLAEIYPEAATTADAATGYVPFVGALQKWVEDVHTRRDRSARAGPNKSITLFSRWGSAFSDSHAYVETWESKRSLGPDQKAMERQMPRNVSVPQNVDWSLRCLTAIYQRLSDLADGQRPRRYRQELYHSVKATLDKQQHRDCDPDPDDDDDDDDSVTTLGIGSEIHHLRRALVTAVASVPCLVKTLLLVENTEMRERLFSLPLVRAAALSHHSIGIWLVAMLKERGAPSHRAVAHLSRLSKPHDDAPIPETVLPAHERHRQSEEEDRRKLYRAIEELEDFIPSMLSLDYRAAEQAATADVVRKIMDRIIARPFAMSVVFFDIIFVLVLICCFRVVAYGFLNQPIHDETGVLADTIWFIIGIMAAYHFVVREWFKVVSLRVISKRLFWDNFFTFWNLIDLSSLIMFWVCSIWMLLSIVTGRTQQNENEPKGVRLAIAVTTGMLWLKFLNSLKVVHKELATYILATLEIIKDISWFMLIFLVVIVMFSQMFYTMLGNPNEEQCQQKTNPFCERSFIQNFYTTYHITLGEFDHGLYYNETSQFFFFAFTIFAAIILLNVLIAIVSDSYDRARIDSEKLFGRARIMFVAELTVFERMLHPDRQHTDATEEGEEGGKRPRPPPQGRVCHPFWLSPMSFLFLQSSKEVYEEEDGWATHETSLIHVLMRSLLGKSSGGHQGDEPHHWNGRSHYMVRQTGNVVDESEQRTRREMRRFESRMMHEVSTLERRMSVMIRQEVGKMKKP
uniref:Ion transport domain-containing protein n=1 Tax=Corethron hystrix TaxID=216773 RepID=A0A7S1BKL7_9STRA